MWIAHRGHWKSCQRLSGLLTALALPGLLAACSIDDVLSVDLPGVVDAADLDDATLAQVLTNGVIGDFECGWANYVAGAAHHDDQRLPTSGNLNMREWGQRKMFTTGLSGGVLATGNCGANYGIYTTLHTARFQGEDVFDRLEGFDVADVPEKVDMQGIVRAYGAYATVALGEGFCSMAIDGGPELSRTDVLAVAEGRFTEAITLAQGTGNTEILNLALVGRARMRIGQQNWAGALADASQVPAGFAVSASRGTEETRRYNRIYEFINGDVDFGRNASIADDYKFLTIRADGTPAAYCDALGQSPSPKCDGPAGGALQAGEVKDPRVNVITQNFQAFDFSTIHYLNAGKNRSRSAPMPIASFKEAQLYMAEAEAQLGNLQNAIDIINARRDVFALPNWNPAAPTQAQVITMVLEERKRELFDEAGHRLNDMHRYRGTQFEIPFLGEPGSLHPNGIDQNSDGYGTITCWDLPIVETAGNENIN